MKKSDKMQYDRTGLPRFEQVPEEEPHYSTYFWVACVVIIFLLWWFL
ncbi:MAG: hypothetical protein WC254_04570 [Candidatus Woesearchaeota archaeon]|jgi:hypothetical protein